MSTAAAKTSRGVVDEPIFMTNQTTGKKRFFKAKEYQPLRISRTQAVLGLTKR